MYDGNSWVRGFVELLHDNIWGTICDDQFDRNDGGAIIVCRMLGHRTGKPIPHGQRQGVFATVSKMWLDDVKCKGSEDDIRQCPHRAWGSNNCQGHEAIEVKCNIGMQLSIAL